MYTNTYIQWSNLFTIYFYIEDCCYANIHRPILCFKDIFYMENWGWQEGEGTERKTGLLRHTEQVYLPLTLLNVFGIDAVDDLEAYLIF